MPTTAAGRATPRRRLALPISAGLAMWFSAQYLLALPAAHDTDGFRTWALAARWGISTTGAVLALGCAYRLARRLEDHLTSRAGASQRQQLARPDAPRRSRRSAAPVLIAVGAAATAASELLWVSAGPLPSWAFVLVDLVGLVVAPAAITLGVYLALRRLEDHLAGRHRTRAPTAPEAGRERHASGMTTPYVRG
ncbi:hypothetical protein [Pseudokineococcus lusitanus]|uniref:Uncharacterized protein n=1 Tax=Pseudokineococcus lusitanus TaxID=763993 RepID=A0A3N1HU44_9ACTN|nr:hypothetical protein [Pseudokineococcus lusitanus]ROP45882.1 hypothetical protein EDC03_0494 [Pseudokineococcus lusitanus]